MTDVILWESVTDVRIAKTRSQKFVVLRVSPALEELLFATTLRKLIRAGNRAFSVDGVVISPTGLALNADALFDACLRYRAAGEHR